MRFKEIFNLQQSLLLHSRFYIILFNFVLYLRHRQKKQQLRQAKAMADLEKEKLSMPSPELPMTQKVIQTIEKEPNQTQEIVEYWMEQHHDKK